MFLKALGLYFKGLRFSYISAKIVFVNKELGHKKGPIKRERKIFFMHLFLKKKKSSQRICRKNEKGMTLIEIMIVIILVGLLATTIGLPVMNNLEKGRANTTKNQVLEVVKSLEAYYLDCGNYPSEQEGLEALVKASSDCPSWGGPYAKKVPKDAWNKEFIYEVSQETGEPVIISLGSDKKEGGTKEWEKDIVSTEL